MPSALDGATRALETRLATAFPTTPIAWPNVKFAAPPGELHLRPWVLWGMGQLRSMRPEGLTVTIGIYQVSIYSPLALGAQPALALADQVRELFTREAFGGVRCDVCSGPVTLPEEPPWYAVAVSIPFSVEETTFQP
jgi:Bacteriophage related domain of unknown function